MEVGTENILTLVITVTYLAVLAFFVTISVILNYHWGEYEVSATRTRKIRGVYFGASGILLLILTALFINLL